MHRAQRFVLQGTYAVGLCLALLGLLSSGVAMAADPARTPLPQEGKKSVYQRVVSHPGAKLLSAPAAGASVINNAVKTFTAFYVYGRQGNMVEVGVSAGKADGWMEDRLATAWPQAITMVFTDRLGRQPVLFFKDHDSLVNVCTDQNPGARITALGQAIAGGKAQPADFPVVATEPASTAVSEKNFYLLPVLETDAPFGDKVKFVRVASINPGVAPDPAKSPSPAAPENELRSGFVFVIDTTISMRPYIEQTLTMIRDIYDRLEKNPQGDKVAFAVVAFRSDVNKSPGIEYTARVVCDFKTVKQRRELEAALSKVEEAKVSTHAYDEDAFAGVKEAVDKLNWEQFGSRAMVLITDAGPLLAGDPTSHTQFSPKVLADYLRTHRIYMTVVHVKTPGGKKNHATAEAAYLEAARQADNTSSYLALDAQTPAAGAKAFDKVGSVLANGYAQLVQATAEGRMLRQPTVQAARKSSPEEEARRIADATGYAMQLQFLGNAQKATAPSVVNAWIADADIERLAADQQAQPVLAARPAVLLSKSQLSQLREQLDIILKSARQSFLKDDDKNFFQSILSAAAHLSRDPTSFSHQPGQNLAQTGVLGEFLEGLPYTSEVTQLTEQDWYAMSTGDRKKFINRLETCILRYDEYDRDNTNWEGFGSANRSEWVYRVPLDMLP